jgi:HAD superfamily hydrolase (TIGR01509 family)
MPYDLLIFDCDGVLVDSEPIANRVFAEALAEIGLAMSYEEVCRRFIGLSMARCLEMVEESLGRPAPEGFVDGLQTRTFEAFRRRGLAAVEGVEAVLDGLDTPVCVASSGEPEKMRLTLGLTGLLPRFEGRMFSAVEVERGKPHPDLFLHAARRMGAEPGRCAVIEDSLPGVQAARAAGMRAFGFAARDAGERLQRAGARVFRSMRDLPSLIAG